jgi:amino-acid N-acetyltransferase
VNLFHQPAEPAARRLLRAAKLPTADLTPEHFQHFFGCGAEEAPQGVVGVELYGADALLRSLVVDESVRGQGCGKALVEQAERYASGRGAKRIYLLTTSAANFFANLGYRAVGRDEAPAAIRGTAEFSALCPSSSAFMVKDLG